MQNKILAPVLLIASIIIIAGFFVMTPTYVTTSGDLKHFDTNSYSFDYPGNWSSADYENSLLIPFLSNNPTDLEVSPQNTSVFNTNSLNNTNASEIINTSATNATDVIIVKTEVSKVNNLSNGLSLENAYQSDSLYKLMSSDSSFSLNSSTPTTIDGHNAYQFTYQVTNTYYLDTWVEDNGKYYRIVSQCPKGSVYQQLEPEFTQIVDSFKIKN